MINNYTIKDTEIDILIRKNETLKDEIAELQRKNSELEIELQTMRNSATSYKAEIERLNSISDRLNDICTKQDLEIEKLKAKSDMADGYEDALVGMTKSEAIKELAEKITEVFMRYEHLYGQADSARREEVESADGTKIELFSVWDVITLNKHGMSEYEEMNRLQENIETIAKARLLTELEKDFRLLVKEMTEVRRNDL